jgi:hypothetical protein
VLVIVAMLVMARFAPETRGLQLD